MSASSRPPKPQSLPFAGLPPALQALREMRQWVAWDHQWKEDRQQWTKPPVNPRTGQLAKSTSPDTWGSFDEAERHARSHKLAGVGFVLREHDDLTGIDLDKCRDPQTACIEP